MVFTSLAQTPAAQWLENHTDVYFSGGINYVYFEKSDEVGTYLYGGTGVNVGDAKSHSGWNMAFNTGILGGVGASNAKDWRGWFYNLGGQWTGRTKYGNLGGYGELYTDGNKIWGVNIGPSISARPGWGVYGGAQYYITPEELPDPLLNIVSKGNEKLMGK
jgi:hypothetical protein